LRARKYELDGDTSGYLIYTSEKIKRDKTSVTPNGADGAPR
jgi:hypothetical protein